MRYSNRLFLYAPILVLLALAITASLRWQAVAGGMETWLRQHNGHEIAPGVTLHFASETVRGFPFNVDAVLANVTFQVKSARTSGSWHADGFAIHELTFGRAQQIYEAAGTQTVSWIDAEGGAHRLAFVPGSLMASAILSRGRLVRFDLDLNGIASSDISGTRLQLHFRKAPDRDAIDIVASADQLHLAPALQPGFGSTLRHAVIDATLSPAAPFAALFEGNDVWDRALETWRRDNGVLRLGKLEMDWTGVQIRASGGLGLDSARRPKAMLSLDMDGAMKAHAGTTTGRLARAIAQLTKAANNMPRGLSLNIASGRVNLWVTKTPQNIMDAGSLGPFY